MDSNTTVAGRFAGKSVIVTGASGDLGQAVVRAFALEGAALGLVYGSDRAAAEALAQDRSIVPASRAVVLAGVDLLAPHDRVAAGVRAACATLLDTLGRCDALIALAGLPARPDLWQKPFEAVTAGDLHAAFAVDTVGTFLFAQALAPELAKSRGAIVVMSSSAARYGDTLGLAYAPAKSANAGLVKLLARVLAPDVRVNGIAPGGIATGWLAALDDAQRKHAATQTLLGRLGTPDEVAQAILELATNGYLTGQLLALDGGIFPR
jgi:NAD(P)-dependent dehydrogenase (short-subunit alcohol dehydrogenase family)